MVITNAERQWLARVQLIISQVNDSNPVNAADCSRSTVGLENRQDRNRSDDAVVEPAA
jgi:hypothetical protein